MIGGGDAVGQQLAIGVQQRQLIGKAHAGPRHQLPLEGIAVQIDHAGKNQQARRVPAPRRGAPALRRSPTIGRRAGSTSVSSSVPSASKTRPPTMHGFHLARLHRRCPFVAADHRHASWPGSSDRKMTAGPGRPISWTRTMPCPGAVTKPTCLSQSEVTAPLSSCSRSAFRCLLGGKGTTMKLLAITRRLVLASAAALPHAGSRATRQRRGNHPLCRHRHCRPGGSAARIWCVPQYPGGGDRLRDRVHRRDQPHRGGRGDARQAGRFRADRPGGICRLQEALGRQGGGRFPAPGLFRHDRHAGRLAGAERARTSRARRSRSATSARPRRTSARCSCWRISASIR